MAKKVMRQLKLQISAGQANPAPPVGTALGPTGINIMDFCNAFNEKTKDKGGSVIPVVLTIYEDRTFDFILKSPPVSDMIKKALNLKKGSGDPLKTKVGTLSKAQIRQIAEDKKEDLNASSVEAAEKIIAGTARSMGIEVEK